MKKLFGIISMLLCMAMLTMAVSAARIETTETPLEIFKKGMDKTCSLKYAELKGVFREKNVYGDRTETETEYARVKITVLPDNSVNAELLAWDRDSEITALNYIKDGYYYDGLEKTKDGAGSDAKIEGLMYSLAGTERGSYKDDIVSITATKTSEGYELRYKISYYYYDERYYSYTVVLDNDYMMKSVRVSYPAAASSPEIRTVYKYEFVSVDKPFVIEYPYDLNTYKS